MSSRKPVASGRAITVRERFGGASRGLGSRREAVSGSGGRRTCVFLEFPLRWRRLRRPRRAAGPCPARDAPATVSLGRQNSGGIASGAIVEDPFSSASAAGLRDLGGLFSCVPFFRSLKAFGCLAFAAARRAWKACGQSFFALHSGPGLTTLPTLPAVGAGPGSALFVPQQPCGAFS